MDLLRKRAVRKNALRPAEKYENTLDSAYMLFGYEVISVLWSIFGWSLHGTYIRNPVYLGM